MQRATPKAAYAAPPHDVSNGSALRFPQSDGSFAGFVALAGAASTAFLAPLLPRGDGLTANRDSDPRGVDGLPALAVEPPLLAEPRAERSGFPSPFSASVDVRRLRSLSAPAAAPAASFGTAAPAGPAAPAAAPGFGGGASSIATTSCSPFFTASIFGEFECCGRGERRKRGGGEGHVRRKRVRQVGAREGGAGRGTRRLGEPRLRVARVLWGCCTHTHLVEQVRVGAMGQQELDHLDVPLLRRPVQRRVP